MDGDERSRYCSMYQKDANCVLWGYLITVTSRSYQRTGLLLARDNIWIMHVLDTVMNNI